MSVLSIWIASQTRNDGTCSTSLRGGTTKQSRNKNIILVTLFKRGEKIKKYEK